MQFDDFCNLFDLQLPNNQYVQNEIWLECKMNLINQLYSNPEPFDIHNAKVTVYKQVFKYA